MRRHSNMRAIATVVAAYGLVLQALLMGLVLGASAAPSGTAPAWAILCSPSGTALAPDGAPTGQKAPRTPVCCIGGACLHASGLAGVSGANLPVPLAFAPAVLRPEAGTAQAHAFRGGLPQARAPPLA